MTYIENIFLCMVSPLLVAALCMGRRQLRFFLFCIAGMGVCLLSAYINTFLGMSGGRPCRHGRDRAGGGGNHEAAAAGILSSGIRAGGG